jgi:hypothetical protein
MIPPPTRVLVGVKETEDGAFDQPKLVAGLHRSNVCPFWLELRG